MSAVNALSRPSETTPPAAPSPSCAPASEPHTLLPDPATEALGGADPTTLLYLFESRDRDLAVAEGSKQVSALEAERHQALAQELKAIQQADDAQNDHNFWDDLGRVCGEVAKAAAVVASVAAAVATAGAAAPIAALAIAGAVLSTTAFVDGECHVLQSLGVDRTTAGWIDTGLAIGGGLLSAGAAFAASGTQASTVAGAVERGGAVVGGVGGVGLGVSAIERGEADARSDQAAADEIAARARSDHTERLLTAAVEDAQNSDQTSQRIMNTIVAAKSIQADTALTAASAVRG